MLYIYDPVLLIFSYFTIGLIFSSFLYVRSRIKYTEDYMDGLFFYYWIFWSIALIVFIVESIKNNYFIFLDKVAEALKEKE